MAESNPASAELVEVVALVTIYTTDPEPAAPGSSVLVEADEAETLIARGHARLPDEPVTLASAEPE